MNLLKLLNVSAIFSMIFNTYLWGFSLLHVYTEHPSHDAFTITLAFILMNGWVWLVLIVNIVELREKDKQN
jgi:hypothetical protein